MASSLLPNYGQFDTQSTSYGLGQELPPELALQAQALNRRQHIANLLTTQGMQPLQGQMAGRFYVPPSWAQGLSQIGQILAGQYMTHKNDTALEDIGQRNQDMQKQAMLDYFQKRNGVPEQPGPDVQVGEKMDLGGMVNTPGGGSAFLNDSGAQPVTAVNPAVQKVAQAQQANYIKGALGSDFAPEGQPNPEYAAALRQNVAGAAQANYPAPVPQAPQNPNMSPVMGPGPNIPAVPGDPKAAMVQLLTDPRLPRGTAHSIAQMQQIEDMARLNHSLELAKRPPIQVKAGDRDIFLDPKTLQPVGEFKIGVSPDAAMTDKTKRDLHATASGDTLVKEAGDMQRHATPSANALVGAADNVAILGPDGKPMINQPAVNAKTQIAGAGASKTINNINSFAPASEEAQKDFMKSTRATYDTLKQAPVALANIEKAKALIPGAKGFMGPGGESLLGATKFLNDRLGMSINTEGVKNAEELRSRIFFNIMDNLKKMDAQPSQMQQQIMQESLGKLGTDPHALSAVLDAYSSTLRDKVDLHNKEVAGAVQRGVKFPYDPTIHMPAPKATTSYVETRTLPDGRVLGKKADGTIEEIK